jgi:hypothetical protein
MNDHYHENPMSLANLFIFSYVAVCIVIIIFAFLAGTAEAK